MTTISTKEQITRELARLRMRRDDESPEAKVMDTEQVHVRINLLLDRLEAEASRECPIPTLPPCGTVDVDFH